MELDKIIESIRCELELEDEIKEKLVEKARLGIRSCGDAIIYAHRNNLTKSRKKIESAVKIIKEINVLVSAHPQFSNYNILSDLYQEFTEAKLFLLFLERNLFPTPQELEVPVKQYILGLADLIGELRRYVLNSIRKEKIKDAEYALDVMEEIFDNIYALETPKSLLSGLRRKCDIARSVIERTRGDVTNAVNNDRLIKHLKSIKENM
ncbi:MAG: hypothetical protein ACTSYR_02770 [Candidatus Odinarchaeia archaeon]